MCSDFLREDGVQFQEREMLDELEQKRKQLFQQVNQASEAASPPHAPALQQIAEEVR